MISGVFPSPPKTWLWENRHKLGTTAQTLKHITHNFLLGLGILATLGEAARAFPFKLWSPSWSQTSMMGLLTLSVTAATWHWDQQSLLHVTRAGRHHEVEKPRPELEVWKSGPWHPSRCQSLGLRKRTQSLSSPEAEVRLCSNGVTSGHLGEQWEGSLPPGGQQGLLWTSSTGRPTGPEGQTPCYVITLLNFLTL